jgi:hypothetical protein
MTGINPWHAPKTREFLGVFEFEETVNRPSKTSKTVRQSGRRISGGLSTPADQSKHFRSRPCDAPKSGSKDLETRSEFGEEIVIDQDFVVQDVSRCSRDVLFGALHQWNAR